MRKRPGRDASPPDDEWYTPQKTAEKLASWLTAHLPLNTPILCPADILPDGSESTIPAALRAAGFSSVRVTRDLPIDIDRADWVPGETIVTNPPFSLLIPFRKWAAQTGAKFVVLARPGSMRNCWSIPEMGNGFWSTANQQVAAAWMQNIHNTARPDESKAIANCSECERAACPKNTMTGAFKPGEDRPLYGYTHAVKLGLAGWHCQNFTVNGKRSFTRFFDAGDRPNKHP